MDSCLEERRLCAGGGAGWWWQALLHPVGSSRIPGVTSAHEDSSQWHPGWAKLWQWRWKSRTMTGREKETLFRRCFFFFQPSSFYIRKKATMGDFRGESHCWPKATQRDHLTFPKKHLELCSSLEFNPIRLCVITLNRHFMLKIPPILQRILGQNSSTLMWKTNFPLWLWVPDCAATGY